MGLQQKRRAISCRLDRWISDYQYMKDLFGDYDPGQESYEADVQRALESLIDAAEALQGKLRPRPTALTQDKSA